MLRVSTDVVAGIRGQLQTSPEMRSSEMLAKLKNENPELLEEMACIFAMQMEMNEQKLGHPISDAAVSAIAKTALLFTSIVYSAVQAQIEVNELNGPESTQAMEPDLPSERLVNDSGRE